MQTPTWNNNPAPRVETTRIADLHRELPNWQLEFRAAFRVERKRTMNTLDKEFRFATAIAIGVWEQNSWEHPIQFVLPAANYRRFPSR